MSLQILHEDKSFYIINKPVGLVVDQSDTNTDQTLAQIMQEDYGIKLERGGIVHRLDKDTSGLIIVARTKEALEALQAQFKERIVKKTYLALVHGIVEKAGEVTGSIGRNPGDREKFIVFDRAGEEDQGKTAHTKYQPTQRYILADEKISELFPDYSKIQLKKLKKMDYQNFTLLECNPLTGRTHQIRVHLKHIGFPIVGDEKYGGRKTVRLDHRWCQRQFLHAYQIQFNHPQTGETLEFRAELPEDLKKALEILDNA